MYVHRYIRIYLNYYFTRSHAEKKLIIGLIITYFTPRYSIVINTYIDRSRTLLNFIKKKCEQVKVKGCYCIIHIYILYICSYKTWILFHIIAINTYFSLKLKVNLCTFMNIEIGLFYLEKYIC